jgi:hypothetical protein
LDIHFQLFPAPHQLLHPLQDVCQFVTIRPNLTAVNAAPASPLSPTSIADLLFNITIPLEEAEACLMTFGAKQLRTECYLRHLRIVKKGADSNDHKIGYVALLVQQKRAFAEMQALGVDDGPAKALAAAGAKRQTRHCMIRLLNVMFSEQFAQRVHQIDCRPTRAELDTSQTQGSVVLQSPEIRRVRDPDYATRGIPSGTGPVTVP